MSSTKIPSPARSLGVRSTPRQKRFRGSRSVSSPARSSTSVKLSSVIQENKKDSFIFSPLPSRRSVLLDNTEIEMPKRRSWWKRLDENSKDVLEFIEKREQHKNTNVEELIDADILSQEKKNYTIDLPESSDGESIRSIVLPQRKLFTQKDQSQKVYKNIIDKRENLERLQKSNVNYDNTINVGKKELFSKGRERSKPVFPAALLNISLDKTELNKKDKDISKQGQVHNLFGNRAGTKRKNMFAEFIVSDSEDEISDIQTKVFGFAKNSERQQPRGSLSNRFRETSPTSDITDVELDEWKLLPSSTMVDNQFGNIENNTPVKKARLSKTMPELEEANKSKSNKIRTSFKNSDKSLKNKLIEDKNQMITENNLQSNNSKPNQNTDELVKVVESYDKDSGRPQDENSPIDLPMVHHDSRKFKVDENVNDGTQISRNISKNDKDFLQKTKEHETSEGNQGPIGNMEIERSLSKNNEANLQEDEEDEANEENRKESGDNGVRQNVSKNNIYDQEDENLLEDEILQEEENLQEDESNDEDQEEDENLQEGESNNEDQEEDENLQEGESNDEDQEKDQECISDDENREEIDDIKMASQSISNNIGVDIQENEEQEFNDDEIVQDNSKKEIQNEIGIIEQCKSNSKNVNDLQENEKLETETESRKGLDKMEIDQNISQSNKDSLQKENGDYEEIDKDHSKEKKHDNYQKILVQSDERQKNILIGKEVTVEESKSINDENKDVVDNQDQYKDDEEDRTKDNQTRTISTKDLNKSQRKGENEIQDEKNISVVRNHSQGIDKDNNQTRANVSNGLNKSQRNNKNQSLNNQDSVRNDHKTGYNKREQSVQNQSKINATHDTTGRYRQRVEHEIKSPEEVRNYIANDMEYISPAGRETSARKTRSVIKLNELRPSLAPLRESTGISDGTYNSSVERSGWDSHRTTRKTLRQTFGKDFTPRKSLRALVMEKSAKRQTYGFDVTTKIPQACSTRLPENMHDITNDDNTELQHENEVNEKVPEMETEENKNEENNKAKTLNSSRKDMKQRRSTVNETGFQLQENDVESDKQTVNSSNILNDEKQSSHSNQKINEISKERVVYQNTQEHKMNREERENLQPMEVNETCKEIQDGEVQSMRNSQKVEAEVRDEEIQDSHDGEVEGDDGEMRDSQNAEIEASEEMQDSHDNQEDAESEDDRNESQNIEEEETDGERESSQEVEMGEESDQELHYSEDNDGQESERIDSQNNEVESEEERVETQHENEESDEGRRYSSQITIEEESDEENVDSQNSSKNVPKQRYFINNSTRDESSNFTEESNREDTLTRRQNIMDILQKVKQQNQEMSRQAEQAVRNSLKRPPRESLDVFKVPLKPIAGLRRLKPVASKPKSKTVKSTHVGIENLPPEVLEDLKYKPPKRYRPSNASWITKRLYKFLEVKLEPKYDYKARVRAEKLAETLYEFAKETRRRNAADSTAVDALKNEMARLGIVSTHFEFYQFFHEFIPREVRIKVVPDIVNKISMPKHGIFSNIIR